MSSLNSRLEKLEKGTPGGMHYVCIIHPDHEGEGYQVSDMQGGSRQTFATLAELEAFEARPDVDLIVFEIVYASKAIEAE